MSVDAMTAAQIADCRRALGHVDAAITSEVLERVAFFLRYDLDAYRRWKATEAASGAHWRDVWQACGRLRRVYQSFDPTVQETVAGIFGPQFHNMIDYTFTSPRKSRGRPVNNEHRYVAERVGWILVTAGLRSPRVRRGVLPRTRDGYYARLLAVVLEAAAVPAREDLFTLIAEVAPVVERKAVRSGRVK